MADSLLYQEQARQCELHSSEEPTAKRQRLQVLNHKKYQAIACKLREQVVTCTHESQILVVIDTTLKAHRAQKRADAIVNLTKSPTPAPPPPITTTKGLVAPSPSRQGGKPPSNVAGINIRQEFDRTNGNGQNLQMVPPTCRQTQHPHPRRIIGEVRLIPPRIYISLGRTDALL
jgi:hypothetical protein